METVAPRWATEDETSLVERLAALQWTRIAVAIATIVGAATDLEDRGPVLLGAMLLFAVAAGIDGVARARVTAGARPSERVLLAAVLVEGAAIVTAVYAGGGSGSPVRYALIIHAATTALLLSGPIAIRSSVWVTLLLLVSNEMQELGLIAAVDPLDGSRLTTGAELTALLVALWLTTLLTARATRINEHVLERERRDQHIHASFDRAAATSRAPTDTAHVLVEHVLRTGPIDHAVVLDVRDEPVVLASHGGVGAAGADVALEVLPGSLLADVVSQRTTAHRQAPFSDADEGVAELLGDPNNISAVPMTAGDDVLGVLLVVHEREPGRAVDGSTVENHRRLASHAALALAHAWAEETLEQQARTDRLTGVANRYTFDEQFAQELARARRERSPLSIVLCDIDHFRRINDLHGHQVGDQVLRDVARTLEDGRRPYDVVARYGGEEFVVILSQTDFDEARMVAERLRREVEAANAELDVTVSLGVATATDGLASRSELISSADAALHTAKTQGRNRVEGARTRAYDPSAADAG